jgi:hypothetical protein
MKTIAHFVQTTIIGGVFFLAPIVVLIVILAKAFEYAKTGVHAVVVHIPAVSELSVGMATALSIAMLALVCLLAGLLARTVPAQHVVNALESSVLSKIPAYEYLKQESASALGSPRSQSFPSSSCLWKGDGSMPFKPKRRAMASSRSSSPARQTRIPGRSFSFPADIIRPAGVELLAALNCLRRCGAGASALGASWPSGSVQG